MEKDTIECPGRPELLTDVSPHLIKHQPDLESHNPKIQLPGDEFRMWGAEIDSLRTQEGNARAESGGKLTHQIDDLNVKIETARDNLIRVFYSIRTKDHLENAETKPGCRTQNKAAEI